jgi:hypothetical protein
VAVTAVIDIAKLTTVKLLGLLFTCWVVGVLRVAPLAIECDADAALLAGILGPAGNKQAVQK